MIVRNNYSDFRCFKDNLKLLYRLASYEQDRDFYLCKSGILVSSLCKTVSHCYF